MFEEKITGLALAFAFIIGGNIWIASKNFNYAVAAFAFTLTQFIN